MYMNTIFPDMSKRRPWSSEEKNACSHHYRKWIAIGSLSGKKQIVDIQQTVPCLQQRSWTQIKNYVRNIIKKDTK